MKGHETVEAPPPPPGKGDEIPFFFGGGGEIVKYVAFPGNRYVFRVLSSTSPSHYSHWAIPLHAATFSYA